MKTLKAYLNSHACPDTTVCEVRPSEPWNRVLVLPARGETSLTLKPFFESLEKASEGFRVLLLLVVNGEITDSPQWKEANQELLTGSFSGAWETRVIDRDSHPLPPKEGVGLARKIGSDTALTLYEAGWLTNPWIYTTDADTVIPKDYFHQEGLTPGTSYFFKYRHFGGVAHLEESHTLYEIHLRYYVLGLRQAASPHAFPTIGSTLLLDMESYAAIRGFPRREAGEDFYILNKLKKVSPIACKPGLPIQIIPRHSDRVPFGTGRETDKIKKALAEKRDFTLYHPATFECLRIYLHEVEKALEEGDSTWWERGKKAVENRFRNAQTDFLISLVSQEIYQQKPVEELSISQRLKRFHEHFDAFRTLRFIHCLETTFPEVPYRDALKEASFVRLDLENDSEVLSKLRAEEEAGYPKEFFFETDYHLKRARIFLAASTIAASDFSTSA